MKDTPVDTMKFNTELDVDKILGEGGVIGRIYLGVQSTDVEAAKAALENTINNQLDREENIWLLEINMYDILKEDGTDMFSGVAEIEFIAEDYRWFVNTILKYGPSAVEIIEPGEISLTSDMMHAIVADAADFAHMYSSKLMQLLKDPERKELYERMLGNGEEPI